MVAWVNPTKAWRLNVVDGHIHVRVHLFEPPDAGVTVSDLGADGLDGVAFVYPVYSPT